MTCASRYLPRDVNLGEATRGVFGRHNWTRSSTSSEGSWNRKLYISRVYTCFSTVRCACVDFNRCCSVSPPSTFRRGQFSHARAYAEPTSPSSGAEGVTFSTTVATSPRHRDYDSHSLVCLTSFPKLTLVCSRRKSDRCNVFKACERVASYVFS